jgi:hypothetical protein
VKAAISYVKYRAGPRQPFSYAIVSEGAGRYVLIKIFDTSGAHVELGHFATRREAAAFVATLPRARRVVML